MSDEEFVHWEPVSNIRKINEEYNTTEETLYTNERNIRALYPNESEEKIKQRIIKNLKANPEYNR